MCLYCCVNFSVLCSVTWWLSPLEGFWFRYLLPTAHTHTRFLSFNFLTWLYTIFSKSAFRVCYYVSVNIVQGWAFWCLEMTFSCTALLFLCLLLVLLLGLLFSMSLSLICSQMLHWTKRKFSLKWDTPVNLLALGFPSVVVLLEPCPSLSAQLSSWVFSSTVILGILVPSPVPNHLFPGCHFPLIHDLPSPLVRACLPGASWEKGCMEVLFFEIWKLSAHIDHVVLSD